MQVDQIIYAVLENNGIPTIINLTTLTTNIYNFKKAYNEIKDS
jgi:hypothetical protein